VLEATADGGGWRLDGTTPWITGWGRIDVVHVAARTSDGRVVWGLVDAAETDGLTVEPLKLAALQASATVRARFEGVALPADRVTLVEDGGSWQARDTAGLASNGALGLGVAGRAIRLLGEARPDVAAHLQEELVARRDAIDTWPPDAVPAARAAVTDLAVRATSTLVVAGGGASMNLGHHAQRLAREAMFLLVQGQTAAIRAAQLALVAGSTPAGTVR